VHKSVISRMFSPTFLNMQSILHSFIKIPVAKDALIVIYRLLQAMLVLIILGMYEG